MKRDVRAGRGLFRLDWTPLRERNRPLGCNGKLLSLALKSSSLLRPSRVRSLYLPGRGLEDKTSPEESTTRAQRGLRDRCLSNIVKMRLSMSICVPGVLYVV